MTDAEVQAALATAQQCLTCGSCATIASLAMALQQARREHNTFCDWVVAERLRLVQERDQARAALRAIPAHRLLTLADWIDTRYPDDPHPEVQRDLRRWADLVGQALKDTP